MDNQLLESLDSKAHQVNQKTLSKHLKEAEKYYAKRQVQQETINQLEKSLEEAYQQIEHLLEENRYLKWDNNRLSVIIEELNYKLSEAALKNSQKNHNIYMPFENDYEDLKTRLSWLEKEFRNTSSQGSNTLRESKELRFSKESVTSELKSIQEEILNKEKQLMNFKKNYTQREQKFSDFDHKLRRSLDQVRTGIGHMKSENSKQRSEIEEIHNRLLSNASSPTGVDSQTPFSAMKTKRRYLH